MILKKKFPPSACRRKKTACSTNVIESLWEKKGKNVLPTRLLETKILDDQKSPTPPPPPPQELNGLPLKYLSLNNTRCSSIVLLLQIEFSFVTNPLIALLCTQKQWKRKSDSINLITTYSQYKSDTNSDE